MFNSQEQQELQIQGLLSNPEDSTPSFIQVAPLNHLFQFADHLKYIGIDPNANIRAFSYLLLHNILTTEHTQSRQRLMRLKKLLLSNGLDLTKISHLPANLQQLLHNESPNIKNASYKKLILQFIEYLRKQRENSSFFITNAFRRYPICDTILCVFIRAILYKQYEISQALNYNHHIADHTLYTILCDAFMFTGLRLEENEAYISNNYLIQSIQLNMEGRLYLLGIKKNEQKHIHHEIDQEFQTFRAKTDKSIELQGDKNWAGTPEFNENTYTHEFLENDHEFSKLDIIELLTPQVRASMLRNMHK